jgi:hypothetical protein
MAERRRSEKARFQPASLQVVSGNAPKHELSQLWTKVHRHAWSWIAVVPADPALSAVPLARAVRDAWNWLSEFSLRLRVAENVDLAASAALIHQLRHAAGTVDPGVAPSVVQTLVAVESPLKNPLVLPIILGADGVILCAERGTTLVSAVRKTVEMIGRDHIIACCLLG